MIFPPTPLIHILVVEVMFTPSPLLTTLKLVTLHHPGLNVKSRTINFGLSTPSLVNLEKLGLILRVIGLPYSQNKKNTTPIGLVVSFVEEAILATLEKLAEAMEREEEPPLFHSGEGGSPLLSGSNSDGGGEEEGNEGEEKEEKPMDSIEASFSRSCVSLPRWYYYL